MFMGGRPSRPLPTTTHHPLALRLALALLVVVMLLRADASGAHAGRAAPCWCRRRL